jgi:parallel beta-helix repeat protein
MTNVTRSVFNPARLVFALVVCVCAAQAAIPVTQCGTTLIIPGGQYELVGNLNCAVAPGVQIGASGISFDLKGFTITGPGFGAGIITAAGPWCKAVTELSIFNGAVANFNAGIALCAPYVAGGTPMYNAVSKMKLYRNADGIQVYNSNNNTIQVSEIFDNRGVGVRFSNAHDNRVVSNSIANNVSPNFSGGVYVPQSNRNHFELNKLVRNGRFGFFIQNSDKNVLYMNTVVETNVAGTPTTGIIVIGPNSQGNYLRGNTADHNQNGISLGCSGGCALVSPEVGGVLDSTLIGNAAYNNRIFGIDLSDNTANNTVRFNKGSGNGVFDGHDDQGVPPCGTNIWQNNTFVTVNQACVQ